MSEFRVLVCGGRDYGWTVDPITKKRTANIEQQRHVYHVMETLKNSTDRKIVIIHGAAKGADTLADEASNFFGIAAESFPADWARHGKAAGHIRNKQMLDEGKPDLVLAFPGGRGTLNMITQAQTAGIPVRIYSK